MPSPTKGHLKSKTLISTIVAFIFWIDTQFQLGITEAFSGSQKELVQSLIMVVSFVGIVVGRLSANSRLKGLFGGSIFK